jgi:hypothetical protein
VPFTVGNTGEALLAEQAESALTRLARDGAHCRLNSGH